MTKEIAKADESRELFDVSSQDKRAKIDAIIARLVDGEDYAKPYPSARKKELLQPGAQKVLMDFNVASSFTQDLEAVKALPEAARRKGPIIMKCTLVHRLSGMSVGEGVGSCDLEEKRGVLNSTLKQASIRALRHAVVTTFALSDRFTQDVDTLSPQEVNQAATRDAKKNAEEAYKGQYVKCDYVTSTGNKCEENVPESHARLSIDSFKRVLCHNHRNQATRAQAGLQPEAKGPRKVSL